MSFPQNGHRSSGFTLIELMIVVVVVAILATIALPSYTDHIRRGKIAEAVAALSDGRVKMEQWFQDNRTYAGGPCPAGTKYFSITCPDVTAAAFTIRATGIGDMAAFVYTIDHSNTKVSNTPWSGPQSCWIVRKGDAC